MILKNTKENLVDLQYSLATLYPKAKRQRRTGA